jgi:MFS transporter, ACS family, glucarate transporter
MMARSTTRVRWFLVFWLFVLSAVSYLDRVNISIAAGSIASAYDLTDVQLGRVFSAMLVGYALFQTIAGRLADRFGARRILTAGVIWWGLFTALTAAVPTAIANAVLVFVLIRFLLGAGEAVIYPSANQFMSRVDLRRCGGGRGPYSSPDHILDDALRLEIFFFGLFGHWLRRRGSLVRCCAR